MMRPVGRPLLSIAAAILFSGAALFAQTAISELPLAVAGVFYAFQFQGPSSFGPLTWFISSGNPAPGLFLSTTGSLTGTPLVAGTFDFVIQATTQPGPGTAPAIVTTQAYRLVVNPALTFITDPTLPDATLSSPYSVSLVASGGLPPYTFTNPGRPLLAGLSLSNSGVISGTPTGVGTFLFTVQVFDSFKPVQTATRTFSITVAAPLTMTTFSVANAIQNFDYSQQFQASGGTPPFTWVVVGGAPPPGLTLTTTGLLQGTPAVVGSASFAVAVTDSRGVFTSRMFSMVVGPPVSTLMVPSLPATLSPAQQFDIGLSLPSPYPSPLSGKLTMSFTSKAEVLGDDPMTRFSTGSRNVDFTIPAGSTNAVFSSALQLITGTVTGTLQLTASIENGPSNILVATVEIAALAPQVTSVSAVRTPGGLDVQMIGYAPVRRVTNIEFTFHLKAGVTPQTVTLPRNVEGDFAAWYRSAASTSFGSTFSFLQSFTVQGDVSLIDSVTVRITNAQGSTTAGPARLQ